MNKNRPVGADFSMRMEGQKDRKTDRQDEAYSSFFQFCESG